MARNGLGGTEMARKVGEATKSRNGLGGLEWPKMV